MTIRLSFLGGAGTWLGESWTDRVTDALTAYDGWHPRVWAIIEAVVLLNASSSRFVPQQTSAVLGFAGTPWNVLGQQRPGAIPA